MKDRAGTATISAEAATDFVITGRVWKFGDFIRGDGHILPFEVIRDYTHIDAVQMGQLCFTPIDPDFPSKVQPGDVIVAGELFGAPITHEQSVLALKQCGIGAILADGFGTRFYRWCIDDCLPCVIAPGLAEHFESGEELRVDLTTGDVWNLTRDEHYEYDPLPEVILEILSEGGLLPHMRKKLASRRSRA